MSAPESDLDRELDELVVHARAKRPSEAQRQAARVGLGLGSGAGALERTAGASLALKLVSGAAFVGVTVVLVATLGRSAPEHPVAPRVASGRISTAAPTRVQAQRVAPPSGLASSTAPMPSAAPVVAPPVPAADVVQRTEPASPSVVPHAAQRFETREAEPVLLMRARTEMRAGQYGPALATVAKHRRLYPTGLLAEERESLGVEILIRAHRSNASAALRAFERTYPRSVHRERLARVLEQVGGGQ